MHVSDNQIFWRNLEKIKTVLLLDDLGLSQLLGMNHKQFLKCRQSSSFLPLDCMFEFAERMNFHLEDLMSENFKMKDPTIQGKGKFFLDERYSYATYSETRPLTNIIHYLESVRGERAKINLIRKFQLTEDFFAQTAQKTNIYLITDIIAYLGKTFQFTNSEFMAIGQRTPFVSKSTVLRDKLMGQKNMHDIVSYFVEECGPMFDQNYHYSISSMDSNTAVIDAVPQSRVLEELGIKAFQMGNENLCLTRMGVISSISYFKYGTNVPVTKIASIHDGNRTHRYHVDLSMFKNIHNLGSNFPRLETSQAIYH